MVTIDAIARDIAEGGFSSIYNLVEKVMELDPEYFDYYNEEDEEADCNCCGRIYYEDELDADGNCPDCVEDLEIELRLKIELQEEQDES